MNSHTPIDHGFRSRPLQQNEQRDRLPARTLSSNSLFLGSTEIAIDHNGAIYRLKITRQGKLILNK